eukprot:13947239-Alexandrium_andersonii.AAC.1
MLAGLRDSTSPWPAHHLSELSERKLMKGSRVERGTSGAWGCSTGDSDLSPTLSCGGGSSAGGA